MKSYPAIDIQTDDRDLIYSTLDDFSPTAIEERGEGLRAFFPTAGHRDAAHRALAAQFQTSAVDVPDDDWARRSQEGLPPVTVGQITVWSTHPHPPIPNHLAIVICPSMGFGTGHHATTRLCLAAMQEIGVGGKRVLDVGTGSGVLAIAARALGAEQAVGIDFDPDAIQSARENLEMNPGISGVSFFVADLEDGVHSGRTPDIIVANLTGALLIRAAATLFDATAPLGHLVLSGLMTTERDEVLAAFGGGTVVWERSEDEWVGLAVKKP